MGLFGSLFGKKKLTLDDADKISDAVYSSRKSSPGSEAALTQKAIKLLTSRKHVESIAAFEQLILEYPDRKATFESQIGANYFFLGAFEKAIGYYTASMNSGFSAGMTDDNIWEASEALYGKTNDKSVIEKYMQQFPSGKFIKKADKILGK